jgi:hypothetical protein
MFAGVRIQVQDRAVSFSQGYVYRVSHQLM